MSPKAFRLPTSVLLRQYDIALNAWLGRGECSGRVAIQLEVVTYVTGSMGLMVFRRTASELYRPFRLPGARLLAPLAFVAATLIVYWAGTRTLTYIVLAVFLGLPLYAWFYAPRHSGVPSWLAAIVGLVFLVALLLTAHPIPFPADTALAGVLALGCYYWAVAAGFKTAEVEALLAASRTASRTASGTASAGGTTTAGGAATSPDVDRPTTPPA